ncbi:MAG: endo-1,4-beta-xylanase, partial [Bacteroidota bacterium]
MIWFNQAPGWLDASAPGWTGQQVFAFSRKYILALGQICGDRVDEWDVINEAISDEAPGGQGQWRRGTWYRRANDGSMTDWGEATYENYIKMLFVWAREAQPEARLHLNDYSIELFNASSASKNRFMRDQVKALKDCGAPIDGVGFQSHFVLADMVNAAGQINAGFIEAIEASMQDLATAGLEVAITELDIRICNNDRDEDSQEVAYREVVEAALSQPNCQTLLMWGLRDEDNWITLLERPPFNGCQDASIVEGDGYTRKAGYDGVAAAIMSLPDRDDFGFAPLNPGDGSNANCGGMGSLEPDVISVSGPAAVFPDSQVDVEVGYVATGDQDILVLFQENSGAFTVLAEGRSEVSIGTGSITVPVDIPDSAPVGTNAYQFQALLVPRGGAASASLSVFTQGNVSVLGAGSQLIVSSVGPPVVGRGDSVQVDVAYSAVAGQDLVVWFQLDQSPFTTFYEFRAPALEGYNEVTATLFIPLSVPIAADAYQFQTILTTTGGGFSERVSNIAQTNVDVEIG